MVEARFLRDELALLLMELRTQERSPDLESRRRNLEHLSEVYPTAADIRVNRERIGDLELEWTRAPAAGSDGVLLYLHGGAYALGSPKSHRHLIAEAGRQAGVATCAPQYRLAPEHPFPAAIDDSLATYRHLLNAGFHPADLVVAGDSAGGGLALSLLLALRDRGLPQPRCCWLLSPWVDLSLSQPSMRSNADRDPLSVEANLRQYADWYLAGACPSEPIVSPLATSLEGLPPTMIQVGSGETLLDEAAALAHRLGAADVSVRLEIWPGVPHVWPLHHPRLAAGRDALAAAGVFLRETRGGKPA